MLPIFRIISVGGVFLAISILALALIPPGGTHLLLTPHDTVARGAMIDPRQHPEWRQFMILAALRRADELDRLRSLPDRPMRVPETAAPADRSTLNAKTTNAEIPNTEAPGTERPGVTGARGDTLKADQTVAGLQTDGRPVDAVETTGSIGDNAGATIPIDIGEASSTELPVAPTEERPPVSGLQDSRIPDVDSASPLTLPAVDTTVKAAAAKPAHRLAQRRPRRKISPAMPQATSVNVPPPFNLIAAFFASLNRAPTAQTTKALAQPAAPTKKPAAKTARQPSYKQASGHRAVAQ